MRSASSFYHSAACNMCSIPVTHSTSILGSLCPQSSYLLSSCAPLCLYELSLCLCTCLQVSQWSQSHKPLDMYALPVKWSAIFPRTQSLAKGLVCVGQSASLCPHSIGAAKGVAAGNISSYQSYLCQKHHQEGTNRCCIFGALIVSLSTNLSDCVWLSTCMLT